MEAEVFVPSVSFIGVEWDSIVLQVGELSRRLLKNKILFGHDSTGRSEGVSSYQIPRGRLLEPFSLAEGLDLSRPAEERMLTVAEFEDSLVTKV